jgi:aspartyl-tRNA(Asn)/glutamyl-tRNA(Gln) amidotransferase subunit A
MLRGSNKKCGNSAAGVVGLKPIYGLVPTRGIVPLVLSLDHGGPILRDAEDAAIKQSVGQLRLGIPRAPFFHCCSADFAKAVNDAIAVLTGSTKR